MKTIRHLLAAVCAAGLIAGTCLGAEAEKKACCEPTVEAQKKCAHKCCVKAAEAKKICAKCHPSKKDEKK
jgi:hypothetical protein